jgi:hypothetical protein
LAFSCSQIAFTSSEGSDGGNTISTNDQIKGRSSRQPIPKVMNFVAVIDGEWFVVGFCEELKLLAIPN